MDADNTPSVRPISAQGGTVEPANRATIAKERFQTPIDVPAERYELRDPFAEVTYRANTFPEMVAKADQLGSNRFVALDAEGRRTTVQKVDGEWQRGPKLAAAPERPIDATPVRDDVPQTSKVVPLAKTQPQADAADAKVIANIDAKAERAALVARLEAALVDRYLIKRAPVTVGDVTVRSHGVQVPRRHLARGFHGVDVPAGDRYQQSVGGAVDGRRGGGAQLARAARVGQRRLQAHGVA